MAFQWLGKADIEKRTLAQRDAAAANLKVARAVGRPSISLQGEAQLSLRVWNSCYSLDSSNQQLGATARLTKTALDNLQVALGRYQSDVASILDVLTAKSAAANARLLRINAELGWQVARAQFALALGRLSGADPLHIP